MAAISFYAASGHGRGPAPTSEDCDVRDQLLAEIPSVVTPEMKSAAIDGFSRDMDIKKIQTCASCGRRDIGLFSTHHFSSNDRSSASLDLLLLSNDDRLAFEQSSPDMQRLRNVYRCAQNRLYHLVREGVVVDESGVTACTLCSACHGFIEKNRVPRFSIANGYDYGRINDLPQPLVG